MADQVGTQHPKGLGCEDCACWHWLGGSHSIAGAPMRKSMGQCRHNPPALGQEWPATGGSDWCWALVPKRKEASHAE